MNKKSKLTNRIITVFIAAMFLLSISVLTAFADQGGDAAPDDGGQIVADDGGEYTPDDGGYDSGQDGGDISDQGDSDTGTGQDTDPDSGNDSGDSAQDSGDNSYRTPEVSVPDQFQDGYEQIRDRFINGVDDLEDNLSQYVPNANLDSLPTVAPTEVTAATAEPLPDVEVSDATLFSGIVMWLCVAVGISVVAGVMVSKRTHRRSA